MEFYVTATTAFYSKYQHLASQENNVYFAGRLATYKYYNMDQVVAQALTLFKKLEKIQLEYNLNRHNLPLTTS